MTPASWVALMLVTVSLIYGGAAVGYYLGARPGVVLTFIGYILANAGVGMGCIHRRAKAMNRLGK